MLISMVALPDVTLASSETDPESDHEERREDNSEQTSQSTTDASSPSQPSGNAGMGRQLALGQNFSGSSRSFGGNATLSNSMGLGTLLSGYGRVPALTSSLFLSPSYRLPTFLGLRTILAASMGLNWRWLDSYNTSTFSANNRFSYSDVSLSLNAPNLVSFGDSGVSIFSSLGATIPVSRTSLALNRLVGLDISANVNWSISDFVASWSPSFSAWLYRGATMSVPCSEVGSGQPLPPVINPQNANFDLEQYLQTLVANRDEEGNGDGTCMVAGRQTIGMLGNSVSALWAPGRHALSVGLGWYINFLRPLAPRPDLLGVNASTQSFTEATMGRIAYSYTIPVDFNLVVTGGVLSYQASFDKQGRLNFPFFDFVTPGKNQTQFFIQLTAGI